MGVVLCEVDFRILSAHKHTNFNFNIRHSNQIRAERERKRESYSDGGAEVVGDEVHGELDAVLGNHILQRKRVRIEGEEAREKDLGIFGSVR